MLFAMLGTRERVSLLARVCFEAVQGVMDVSLLLADHVVAVLPGKAAVKLLLVEVREALEVTRR